ncbi:MAG TPA: alpha-L-fucosidase, partial [Tangfeifania sp.]|nr:alpha-L-fucosidase [Tangfeifania sp.]
MQWQNAELAALVCWDLHAHDGEFYVQSKARITPVEDYNIFNPKKYDTDQWIKTLKEAGFKIAILTVSHETGFFHHQSDAMPYNMKALKWQNGEGDVLRDFKASCEKY